VQKRAQATPARVEKLAREKLQMQQATPGITSYVTYSAPTVAVSPKGDAP
jgi:cell division protein FtsL